MVFTTRANGLLMGIFEYPVFGEPSALMGLRVTSTAVLEAVDEMSIVLAFAIPEYLYEETEFRFPGSTEKRMTPDRLRTDKMYKLRIERRVKDAM